MSAAHEQYDRTGCNGMLGLIRALILTIIIWVWLSVLFFEKGLPISTFYRWLGGGLLVICLAALMLLWKHGRRR